MARSFPGSAAWTTAPSPGIRWWSSAPPPELLVEFDCPRRGPVRGMGVPKGVTLIVGGGYHGKSTLLTALEKGVYNHIPGDGREFAVTVPDAVKVRAEDGCFVGNVDISQTRAIGEIIYYALKKHVDGRKTLREILDRVEAEIDENGLDIVCPYLRGDYARPRSFEVSAAINRLRTLRCR